MNPKIKKIVEISLIIISIGAIFYGAYFFGSLNVQKKYQQKSVVNIQKEDDQQTENLEETVINEPASIPINPEEVIKKGEIVWQDPQNLGDLGLTSKELYSGCEAENCGQGENYYSSQGIKYLKVGRVTAGKFAGHDLIVVSSSVSEGPSILPIIFRVLKKDNDYIFISNPAYGIDQYSQEFIGTIFSGGTGKKEFNDGIGVEELDYPEELYGPTERERFLKDPYALGFFTDAKLKKVFINQKYGQVWMTDSAKAINKEATPFELNSFYNSYNKKKEYRDIFGRAGFYMKAADGTAVVYKMKMDMFEEVVAGDDRYAVLKATWNDGSRNTDQYEKNPSGCGSGDYAYDETADINPEKDLILVGKTDKGDDLYGYRDDSSSGFKKLYNEIYYAKNGETKKSPKEFLGIHPKVFWRDYYGRILAFYNSAIISPAECGKPVIYLYPEKEEEISVEVKPGKGFSYTDPEYKDGWRVLAKTNGELTNLADGKIYPYLFWEGASDVYYETPQAGFSVSDGELDSFFQEKLAQLGLIQKEINDFKEFWIPKMRESEKPYYFVTFLSKNYIDKLAPLTVSPKPDSVIRVMMDYEALDKPIDSAGLNIKTPERKGFTVVEWGGMLK